MKKFKDLDYNRPDFEAEKASIRDYIANIKKVSSYEELRALFLEREKEDVHFRTMQDLALFRNSIDTRDSFYDTEVSAYNQAQGEFKLLKQEASRAILESPYVDDLEKEFGARLIRGMKNELLLASPEIVDEIAENALLCQEFQRVISSCSVEFKGELCNFSKLLKYMHNVDRKVRKEAFDVWADMYEKVSPELDRIYDQMNAVRKRMAEKLGFANYVEYSFTEASRDFTPEQLAHFRDEIKEYIVPICERICKAQKERLGVEEFYWYDEMLTDPDGSAAPVGNAKEMLGWAQEMYREMSSEIAECFDFMVEYDMFDLESRVGKQPGGYCELVIEEKAPFIFANFNGTSADMDVLTHEVGHAFEGYLSAHTYPLSAYIWASSETNEIHSMSMEFFTYPWMEKFFGDKADRYRRRHLEGALLSVAYIICVDEFQYRVFEENLDAEGRRKAWRELEGKYMPWRQYDDNAFLNSGGFWMQKQHIFLNPFYYMHYALAEMSAFEFYKEINEDYKKAWEKYHNLCKIGGSKDYFDTLELAGLSNPFHEGTVKKIAEFLTAQGL